MSEHDPLCEADPCSCNYFPCGCTPCMCHLIAKVRADQTAKAIAAVEALSHEACAECCEVDAIATLRALGGSDE